MSRLLLSALFLVLVRLPLAAAWEKEELADWNVQVRRELRQERPAEVARALDLIRQQLEQIVKVVPAPAVSRLREVTLWISPPYPGVTPRAEYHPGAGWLRENGRDPAMVKGVEFTNTAILEREIRRMPVLVLHELAHAYHDQVLGFENAAVKSAFATASASGVYDRVERQFGDGRPNSTDRAYALSNEREYFAETTEAFFGRNDFFPFERADLLRVDPAMAKLLARLWQLPSGAD